MFRIGVLGTDSTHVEEFLRHLNREERFPGLRITAALAENPARDAAMRDAGLAVRPTVADVVAQCDGILVTHRVGGRHPALATPGLTAGLPTFVDKPLATTHDDAARLLRLAAESGAPLGSCSVLRLHPEVVAARDRRPDSVEFSGPASCDSPYDGLFFYGTHSAEAACAIALGDGSDALPEDVTASRRGGTVVVGARLDGCDLRLVLDEEADGFSLDVGGGRRDVGLGEDYLAPVSAVIADVMRGGPTPDLAPTLAAIALLEQVQRLLA